MFVGVEIVSLSAVCFNLFVAVHTHTQRKRVAVLYKNVSDHIVGRCFLSLVLLFRCRKCMVSFVSVRSACCPSNTRLTKATLLHAYSEMFYGLLHSRAPLFAIELLLGIRTGLRSGDAGRVLACVSGDSGAADGYGGQVAKGEVRLSVTCHCCPSLAVTVLVLVWLLLCMMSRCSCRLCCSP